MPNSGGEALAVETDNHDGKEFAYQICLSVWDN